MSNNSNSSSGIGFTSLLQLLFIALKLLNITVVATWSWWWVLSPTWITASLAILIIGIWLAIKFWPKKKPIKNPNPMPLDDRNTKSKFMQRLDEAMERSAERKRQ